MKKTCSWLLALTGLLAVVGTTRADTPVVIGLLLPQMFGHEPTRAAPAPAQDPTVEDILVQVKETWTGSFSSSLECPKDPERPFIEALSQDDDEWLGDLLLDGMGICRMLFGQGRHQEIDALAELLVRVATAQKGAVLIGAPCCEVLPMPKVVCAAPPGCGGLTCGGLTLNVPACYSCAKPCGDGPTCAKATDCGAADACDDDACCTEVVKAGAKCCDAAQSAKACKCCEGCTDCKDCKCSKTVRATASCGVAGSIVLNERNFDIRPGTPVFILPLPPPLPGMPPPPMAMCPFGLPLPPPPMQVHLGPQQFAFEAMHAGPGSPVEELKELLHQREAISLAIKQVQLELVRVANEKCYLQAQAVPVAHNAQKVHLVTEHFEAHCDALHCVNGDPHRVVLSGDVRLTCKKCGQFVRIEAPRVIVNMKDGTFSVETAPIAPPAPVLKTTTGTWQPMPLPASGSVGPHGNWAVPSQPSSPPYGTYGPSSPTLSPYSVPSPSVVPEIEDDDK